MSRVKIAEFGIIQKSLASAVVTVYVADSNGENTGVKAVIYQASTGAGARENPQTLDTDGKLSTDCYVDSIVMATITGISDTTVRSLKKIKINPLQYALGTTSASYKAFSADDATASAAAALVSENNAAADAILTAADVVLTNADVVLTGADVALTNADVVLTNADVVLTNADVVTAAASAATIPSPVANKFGALIAQNNADDGYELVTVQGTSGQVLKSNGSDALPSFQEETDPGLVLLATATASASTSIDFTSFIDGTYDHYILEWINLVPSVDDVALQFRTSSDGGATFDSGSSDYGYSLLELEETISTFSALNSTGNSFINMHPEMGNVAGENSSGRVDLYAPSSSNITLFAINGLSIKASTSRSHQYNGKGVRKSAGIVDAVRFYMSSGNISTGEFKLYGVKK